MLTGADSVFGTQVVALRHQGPLTPKVKTLAEICRGAGYNTTCVGFGWNPASRGFDKYIEFTGWGSMGRGPQSESAKTLTTSPKPEIDRLSKESKPLRKFMMLRHMDPHCPTEVPLLIACSITAKAKPIRMN